MQTVMKLKRGRGWRNQRWVDSRGYFILCVGELNKFFYIPEDVKKIDLIISDKFITGSYKVIMKCECDNMLSIHKRNKVQVYHALTCWISSNGYTNKTLYGAIEY